MPNENSRPSILCVTSELPWPLDSGGHLRTYYLLRALAGEFRVRLIAGWTSGDPEHVRALERIGVEMRPVAMSRPQGLIEGARAARARMLREPYVLYHRHNRTAIRTALQHEIRTDRPDLLYFDHLDSCVFADEAAGIPFVADFHNIYSLIADRESAEPSRSFLSRQYLSGEARLLQRVEKAATRGAGAVFAVSERERSYFAGLGPSPVHLVPNGVDCAKFASLPVGRQSSRNNVLFVGSLAWPPNVAAVQFLAKHVHPRVLERWSDARLTIVGRDPGPEIQALAGDSVQIAENVPDITPYLAEASLLAVPLAAGGGTRLKILEGFAAGLPIVSTPVGCEGIAAEDGRELLIAEADGFADAVIRLLADTALGETLADRGRELARRQYDWSVIGAKAVAALKEILVQPRR